MHNLTIKIIRITNAKEPKTKRIVKIIKARVKNKNTIISFNILKMKFNTKL